MVGVIYSEFCPRDHERQRNYVHVIFFSNSNVNVLVCDSVILFCCNFRGGFIGKNTIVRF